jgi:hypothetical protein
MNACMFDPSSVSVEDELNACMREQQVPIDTGPLMWWKQHRPELPQYLVQITLCATT